jgi:hypothetical protein
MTTRSPHTGSSRRTVHCALLLSALLFLALPAMASDNDTVPAGTFEQRAAVEKASRSRYRDLEVASLLLILVGGGAAIWWTFKRK